MSSAITTAPSLQLDRIQGRASLRAFIRLPGTSERRPADGVPGPFFTVLGFNLCPVGGAAGAVFAPKAPPRPEETFGKVAISVSALSPNIEPGRWVFLMFAGDEVSKPLEVDLTDDDIR